MAETERIVHLTYEAYDLKAAEYEAAKFDKNFFFGDAFRGKHLAVLQGYKREYARAPVTAPDGKELGECDCYIWLILFANLAS